MTTPKSTTNTVDTSVPHPPTKHLSEEEKKALELSEHAEHETGGKREKLQTEAKAKTSDR